MWKLFYRRRFPLNPPHSPTASCIEFLWQRDGALNPACWVAKRPRTVVRHPQNGITCVGVADEFADANPSGGVLETMFYKGKDQCPVISPADERNIRFPEYVSSENGVSAWPIAGQNRALQMGSHVSLINGVARRFTSMSLHMKHNRYSSEHHAVGPERSCADLPSPSDRCSSKPKRKKLKGKRAVVRWLKFFRWKKKKELSRMTAEEKILHKLQKAKKKEARLTEALEKIEPSEDAGEIIHDPEVLTPEEHFYLLKMGRKSKNYVPVGRRGVFQGVILNMHLHWKKHQTLKVIVKTFTPAEVREIAAELARLTGGIILEIEEEDTIIMYRGKNYVQPPTEIMSPKATLSRKKALDKSKYIEALQAVRKYIPRLEEDMEALRMQAKAQAELGESTGCVRSMSDTAATTTDGEHGEETSPLLSAGKRWSEEDVDDLMTTESEDMISESDEDLSDLFDVDDSNSGVAKKEAGKPTLYVDKIEGFFRDQEQDGVPTIPLDSSPCSLAEKHVEELPELDEIDKMFLNATTLLKKRNFKRSKR